MRFYLLHDFKHWLNATIFGCMLLFTIHNLLLWNTIPNAVADIDVQWMFFSGQNITLCFRKDPLRNTVHLDMFNFNPDSLPNCLSVSKWSFRTLQWKTCIVGEKRLFYFDIVYFYTFNVLIFFIIMNNISIQTMNK